ncbi:hypothetical protein MFLAVUS_004781 [Mucor flavus]|uniref:Protein Abitram n=1 Tax=Mucor flavus TaxID=439312 RepID=A0ABP9YWV4_9FUNG
MDEPADYDIKDYSELTNDWNRDPTAYLNRYYSLYYKSVNKESDPLASDVYVRQSPNKICVLGISNPSTDIEKIVMNTSLIGEKVKKNTTLCTFENKQGEVIGHVKAEMEGKLLELNDRFKKEGRSLLFNGHHMDTGFIAIILPKTDETKIQLKGYQTAEEYKISLLASNNNSPILERKPAMCNIS